MSAWLGQPALIDPVIGVPNHQGIMRSLFALAEEPLQVAMIVTRLRGEAARNPILVDVAIQQIARLVLGALPGTIIGRISAAELLIVLPEKTQHEAENILDALCSHLSRARIHIGDQRAVPYTSLGMSAGCLSTVSPVFLVEKAREEAREDEAELGALDSLIYGISETDFRMLYQPIVSLNNGEVQMVEALARFVDDHGQHVSPLHVVAAAERAGTVCKIDEVIARRALKDMCMSKAAGAPTIGLCINLSAASLLDRKLVDTLCQLLLEADTDGVVFELTETMGLYDIAKAGEHMRELRGAGAIFSLDDFGTGHANFEYLERLPFEWVKIDGRFVHNASSSVRRTELLRSINRGIKSLGALSIAEHIESEADYTFARSLGIDYGQGYFIGRPQPKECFTSSVP